MTTTSVKEINLVEYLFHFSDIDEILKKVKPSYFCIQINCLSIGNI